jgi:hypothetical protein
VKILDENKKKNWYNRMHAKSWVFFFFFSFFIFYACLPHLSVSETTQAEKRGVIEGQPVSHIVGLEKDPSNHLQS